MATFDALERIFYFSENYEKTGLTPGRKDTGLLKYNKLLEISLMAFKK